jgi:MSHA biogenesis protein MshL
MKPNTGQKMKLKIIAPWLAASLAACSNSYPPRDTSALDTINKQLKQTTAPKEKASESALPEAVSNSLLPPLRRTTPKISSKQLEQRFDLVVKDAPVNQVFMGIISDTPYSIMVKPKNAVPQSPLPSGSPAGAAVALDSMGLTDKVTVNLKNVTMFEALDALREVYGYDYTVEDYRIYVQQPELQTRLFQVNYVLGQRRGVSDLQVIGGASTASPSSGSGSGSGSSSGSNSSTTSGSGTGGSYSSIQASALSTITKSDIWGEVQDALRTTLGCQVSKELPTSRAASAGGGRADVSFVGEMQSGERQRGADGCTEGRAMTVNPMSGTILVRAMPHELRTVEKMLRTMQLNIERQVIIEAKIIDVELNSGSQQGINWAGFQNNLHRVSVGANIQAIDGTTATNGGAINAGTSLGGLLGTTGTSGASSYGYGNAFTAGVGIALQLRNFSALMNFLQTQGSVHVLSSPRISTLNNQKAVIKVGTEEPYVSSISSQQTQTVAGGTSTTTLPTLNYQPFFSGIALDVTPQIDDKDNITLHVHSMVNSIAEKYKIAQLGLADTVPFAVNTINETDSVVKTMDGQVIVIGGLMTESTQDNRAHVPGLGKIPVLGALFNEGAQRSIKRELVILLKPTEVKDSSAWTNDIAGVESRIENLSAPPKSKTEQSAENPATENK